MLCEKVDAREFFTVLLFWPSQTIASSAVSTHKRPRGANKYNSPDMRDFVYDSDMHTLMTTHQGQALTVTHCSGNLDPPTDFVIGAIKNSLVAPPYGASFCVSAFNFRAERQSTWSRAFFSEG